MPKRWRAAPPPTRWLQPQCPVPAFRSDPLQPRDTAGRSWPGAQGMQHGTTPEQRCLHSIRRRGEQVSAVVVDGAGNAWESAANIHILLITDKPARQRPVSRFSTVARSSFLPNRYSKVARLYLLPNRYSTAARSSFLPNVWPVTGQVWGSLPHRRQATVPFG